MKIENYRLFARLCEDLVKEDSTSLDIVKKNPGGQAVIKQLHTTRGLAHDQSYGYVPKIAWSDLKNAYQGAWVIIIGSTGTGAIKASGGTTGSYEALASNGGEVKTLTDGRGGNILDFLKRNIGALQQYYVGTNSFAVRDLKSKRKSNNQVATTTVTPTSLTKKFKPMWAKGIKQAIPDIKGMVVTMVKNDAFEKAEKKLSLLKSLEEALYEIENGENDSPSIVSRAVSSAITMSASHYYPDETGEITRASRYSGSGISPQNMAGTQRLLADIASGDTQKLGTILAFFKRNLISG